MVIVMPFMAVLIFPLVANFEIKNINLAVVDNDKSTYSQQLIQKVSSSGYFRISDVSDSYPQALRSVELNKSDIILEIPPHFERDMAIEKGASVLIAANSVSGTKGGLGSSYLAGIIGDFSSNIRSEWITASDRFFFGPV